jgi:hypothetical protein
MKTANMENLTDYFVSIIQHSGSIDIAEAEFKKTIANDKELKHQYKEWCLETGASEKHGFLDFCDEYIDSQNSIWDSLSEYDDYN